jgi:hypothetical protein
VAKKSWTSSMPKSLGGNSGLTGLRDLWACNSESRLGIDFPDTGLDRGENSLRSNSIPRTKI